MDTKSIVLGGGCFWCLEAVYLDVEGVVSVESGYAGGAIGRASYEQVCSGETGHAEVVRVVIDPAVIGERDVLEIFFAIHDPTTRDRQGADVGSQYRSVIFYADDAQRDLARETIAGIEREEIFAQPVVTELSALPAFYPAEAYHQRYFERNPHQGYCMAVVGPKVAKFRKRFAHRLRSRARAPGAR
ncbi:MAG: peptide-methionine (S)-S-oxide reductase MsrA [Burkholderiaceae bacterium]|nr:peptide-methionine (S)-S-oxide reductase MsrA [Burkholderiaceae bacterium]